MADSKRFVRVEDDGGVRIVRFHNLHRLMSCDDEALRGELFDLVEQRAPCPVVLDFENQSFIPHASIEVVLLCLHKRLPNGLVMCNLCRDVREHFAVNYLDRIFRIYDAREEAISAALNE